MSWHLVLLGWVLNDRQNAIPCGLPVFADISESSWGAGGAAQEPPQLLGVDVEVHHAAVVDPRAAAGRPTGLSKTLARPLNHIPAPRPTQPPIHALSQ